MADVLGATYDQRNNNGGNMNNVIRLTVATIAASLLLGASGVAAQTNEPAPNLKCATVEECQVVIDELYPQLVQLGSETNTLRTIRDRNEAKIERQERRIAKLKSRLRSAR